MKTATKILIWVIVLAILALGVWFGVRFYFVWGTGVRAGNLNQVVYKGWIWKTYEGSTFSIADSLSRCSGKNVQVKYREYRGALPWRGMQRYIVYDILSVSNTVGTSTIPFETN